MGQEGELQYSKHVRNKMKVERTKEKSETNLD